MLQAVKAGFIMQNTTLTEWCRANGIEASWAFRVLRGAHRGEQSLDVRGRLVEASMAEKLYRAWLA